MDLLHYVTRFLPDIQVLFIDTQRHFRETRAYRDRVAGLVNLNLHIVRPDPGELARTDPEGDLSARDPGLCGTRRKVFPLTDALAGRDCWFSGRKRFQSDHRAAFPVIERVGDMIKLTPLALRTPEQVAADSEVHVLPPHPLEPPGYPSIGCAPCTRAVKPGEDRRAGRWADTPGKSQCGIHLGPDGQFRGNNR